MYRHQVRAKKAYVKSPLTQFWHESEG
jgi:hypothetical protein